MPIDLQQILTHALTIGLRVGGVMSFAPFLGSASIPVRVRAAFTIVLTALLYPVVDIPHLALTPVAWTRLALSEAILGLALGLTIEFVFEGAQMAGQIGGFQFAFSLVNVIDPQSDVETPVLSVFHQLVVLLLFLQLNVHHWILRGLVKSFEFVPPGSVLITDLSMKELFHNAGAMWVSGVQLATPVLLATMLIDVTVGFLSKASPQMSAIFLSIPLKSLVGYGVLAIALGMWPGFFEKEFALAIGWSDHLLRLSH
ncbi:MAG: flagellar biosynthetic protein FliR [Candidatus Acidiferrum sp.]